jgi:tRNA threonylcarbamoyladenosine modification (KEOPS) complex Cgi121 subunit
MVQTHPPMRNAFWAAIFGAVKALKNCLKRLFKEKEIGIEILMMAATEDNIRRFYLLTNMTPRW